VPVLIRAAHPADAEAMAGVHVASWQGAYRGVLPDDVLDGPQLAENRLRLWQRLLGEPGPRQVDLVAENPRGRIVGVLHAGPARDEDADAGTAEVLTIYAAPEAWGSGAGRELMTAALGRLRAAGFRAVTLWVLDSNERARRFYGLAGFAPDGTTKDDVMAGTTISEVRYRRQL
jgi:GNAT superfamily N-acetyltransferase